MKVKDVIRQVKNVIRKGKIIWKKDINPYIWNIKSILMKRKISRKDKAKEWHTPWYLI